MANWRYHSKALTAFRRRWRMNIDPTEILTGILPTAQVDKHWQDDTLDLFGLYTQHLHSGVTPRYVCCGINAGSREVLVHEVTAWVDPHSIVYGWPYHLMTCHRNYFPAAIGTSLWFPWLNTTTRSDYDISLPHAFGFAGEVANLQTVNVPPHGAITCVGKTLTTELQTPGAGSTTIGNHRTFWSYQDPPIRIKPYVRLIVQSAIDQQAFLPVPGVLNLPLNVNFIFSERDAQGDVG